MAGNLTRDPELRYTPKGTAVCKFSIAINRSWQSEGGEKKEEVTFVEITAWGKQAEIIGQYFKKGRPIFVEGRLDLEQWEDKNTKQKRQALRVVMESFQFVGNKPDGDSPSSSATRSPARSAASAPAPGESTDAPPPEDDDVPF